MKRKRVTYSFQFEGECSHHTMSFDIWQKRETFCSMCTDSNAVYLAMI
jgi:hypothetical protein